MAKTYRRFSTECKLQLVEVYLAGAGSMKGIATGAGIGKYRAGELSLDVVREETLIESEQKVAALERKVEQLTMELDLLKGSP